ncbi:uncharacterized protein LOC131880217 isoform X2 [Tigriopus californicus]|uniref:uncharacterized protein LOC131880217 isoform X2 n=1 Tax=Tigriopus californicus TaxID=6832 RepID=UPI0027DA64A0|nr:uncharacterized protein LOC131880217 isoform X2 [Tigriopus californicus]
MTHLRGILIACFLCQVALSKPLQRAPGTPDNPQLQYHVQTDQGPERFFRFQTLSGQYRKEQILPDGSVVGSYGWVDPNGVLRLFDYVSDNLGYRIEKQRLFKVGKITEETATLETRGGDLNLGFEVFPLDFDSDPAFNGLASAKGGVPLGGTSGFRSIHGPEGSFHLTPSYQVASLTSTNDPANPISKQGQATFFEGDPILVQPIQEKPKIVIGARQNSPREIPAPRKASIVIGYAANDVEIRRPANTASTRTASTRVGSASPSSRQSDSSNRRPSGIVIGRTARMLTI